MSISRAGRSVSLLSSLALLASSAAADTTVRVATWNLESVGPPASVEYLAALAVLERIDADVVAVHEVSSEADVANLSSLAADAGYPYVVVPVTAGPFGTDRSAMLCRPKLLQSLILDSVDISEDPNADDITRFIVQVVVDIPGTATDLTLVTQHWKSGTGDEDEFRRVVESIRIRQTLEGLDPLSDAYVVMGDLNEEIDSVPQSPDSFTEEPAGLPAAFVLGADITLQLAVQGLPNDPFSPLLDVSGVDLAPLPALQLDGSDATRPSSGRRLDYVMLSPALQGQPAQAEVYDSMDEGLPGGLPKQGSPLAGNTSLDASGSLLVFADIVVPVTGTALPALPPRGLLLLAGLLSLTAAARLRASVRAST